MNWKNQPFFPLLLTFLFFAQLSFAQNPVSFAASMHTVDMGEVVEVEFSVADFNSIVSTQFTVDYDPTVLNFLDVGDFDLAYLSEDNFGLPQEPNIPDGKVTLAWYDQQLDGETLNDGTVIFVLSFEVIGMPGDSSSITFGNDPTTIEVSDPNGMVMNPVFEPGYVKVTPISGVRKVVTDAFVFHPVFPNPVQEVAYLEFDLLETSMTRLIIYDLTGRIIFESSETRLSGSYRLEIPAYTFPAGGAYFCRLEAGNHAGVQQILVVR